MSGWQMKPHEGSPSVEGSLAADDAEASEVDEAEVDAVEVEAAEVDDIDAEPLAAEVDELASPLEVMPALESPGAGTQAARARRRARASRGPVAEVIAR